MRLHARTHAHIVEGIIYIYVLVNMVVIIFTIEVTIFTTEVVIFTTEVVLVTTAAIVFPSMLPCAR